MSYHERRLPHWQPEDAAIFLTWHLHGSIPHKSELIGGKAFVAMDRELDHMTTGPRWLDDLRVAACVAATFQFASEVLRLYDLLAWVLMGNHAHILIRPTVPLPRIMKTIKGYSARQANAILGRAGLPFWQHESFDRWARNADEVARIMDYIESNPVTAGFVERPEDWRWSSAFKG